MSIPVDSNYARYYRELMRIAQAIVRERPWSSATPSDLVHESFLRLQKKPLMPKSDEPVRDPFAYFRVAAATTMIRVIAERARLRIRRQRLLKQRGEATDVDEGGELLERAVGIERVIDRLAAVYPLAAQAFVLQLARYEIATIAETLGKSVPQTRRYLTFARTWLARELELTPVEPDAHQQEVHEPAEDGEE